MSTSARRGATLALLAALVAPVTADEAYRAEIQEWRRAREAQLKGDGGWLTLAGLFWLKEGPNWFGTDPSSEIVLPEGSTAARSGVISFHDGRATLRLAQDVVGRIGGQLVAGRREMRPDSSGAADELELGSLTMYVIERGGRFGVRVKDKNSPIRKGFKGLDWYPIDEGHRVEARWVSYPSPRPLKVPNVLGETEIMPSPGHAEFELGGQVVRLAGVLQSPQSLQLFFILRDETSGKETYGSGRFLYSELPKRGRVVLDFNKAYNPPCAFTPHATCPLPPKQNWLPVAVRAGEKAYGDPAAH